MRSPEWAIQGRARHDALIGARRPARGIIAFAGTEARTRNSMKLDLQEVAKILSSRWKGAGRMATGYSIDSRTIKPGQLFFAIKGPKFDGHDFVRAAMASGASGAVVCDDFLRWASGDLQPDLIAVRDTAEALENLACSVRRRWGGRLVGVTGSAGKTTTKEMTASLLSTRFSVLKSPGNLNNLFGLPQALLALEPVHDLAVVELAMSAPGEIARLARISEPDVGVVTNVAPVHLAFFDSVEGIAAAKRELIQNLSRERGDPTAVLNEDDSRVRKFREGFGGRVATFGMSPKADVRAEAIETLDGGGSSFRVRGNLMTGEFHLRLPGRHNVENALAALAVAGVFGVHADEAREALLSFGAMAQRNEVIVLPGGISLLNDSYNSNPRAMERMLETLAEWPGASRLIVVAGEMLELGKTSPELHRAVGRKMAAINADWLIAVRGDARFFVEGAVEAGLPRERALFFAGAAEAAEFCRKILEPGDVVLVKGSRGVHLEGVTQALAGAPAEMRKPE